VPSTPKLVVTLSEIGLASIRLAFPRRASPSVWRLYLELFPYLLALDSILKDNLEPDRQGDTQPK
jgi:hypothetical protein